MEVFEHPHQIIGVGAHANINGKPIGEAIFSVVSGRTGFGELLYQGRTRKLGFLTKVTLSACQEEVTLEFADGIHLVLKWSNPEIPSDFEFIAFFGEAYIRRWEEFAVYQTQSESSPIRQNPFPTRRILRRKTKKPSIVSGAAPSPLPCPIRLRRSERLKRKVNNQI